MSGVDFSAAKGPAKWAATGSLATAAACALAWSLSLRPRSQVRELPPRPEVRQLDGTSHARAPDAVPVTVLRDPPAELSQGGFAMSQQMVSPVLSDEARSLVPSQVIEIHVVDRTGLGPHWDDSPITASPAPTLESKVIAKPASGVDDTTPAPATGGRKGSGEKGVAPGVRINVNTASKAELELLPGIGPAMAARIIEERQKQRFARIEDLDRVKGIGPKTLDRLRPYITVDAPAKPR